MSFRLLALSLLCCGTMVRANTFTFSYTGTATSSASGSSAAASASVTVTTGNGSILLTIWNNQVGITRDIQAISAITFVAQAALANLTMASRDGAIRTLAANGTYTDSTTRFGDAQYDGEWVMGTTSTATSTTLDINAFGGGSPMLTIVGAANSNNLYQTGNQTPNKAVTGHNPYLVTDASNAAIGAVTFRIAATGVTAATNISSMRINFGTDRTATYDAISSVPEPPLFALIGLGLAAISLRRRRSSR